MIELYINNIRAQILTTRITINKQVNDLSDLKDRQATYTNKFKIAKTPKMLQLFNNLGIVGNTSRSPYEVLKCKLIYNGVELLKDGNAYITSSGYDYYDVTIYDGNIFLFQQIGSGKINELNFIEYQHQLTEANYISSYANTSGYIYAISDNGRFIPTDVIEINYQLPSFFVHTLWDKIFKPTDYTYEFVDFDRIKFDKLVITPKRGYNSEFDVVHSPFDVYGDKSGTFGIQGLGHVDIIIEPNSTYINDGKYIALEGGQYEIFTTFIADVPANYSYYQIMLNGNILLYEDRVFIDPVNTPNISTNYSVIVSLRAGEYIETTIHFEKNGVAVYDIPYTSTARWRSVNVSVIDMSINSFIGDLTQKDFLKAIMQHFGFVMQLKLNTNIYQFKRIQDILLDTENAIDWSDKYVSSKKESYQLKGYAQLNRMAYSYYEDNADKNADGFLIVDNENLKTEKVMFRSPFNACDTSDTLLNNTNVTSTPFWQAVRDDTGAIVEHKPVNNKNYLAEVKRTTEGVTYGLKDSTPISYTGNVPRLDFTNLNYNTIISENYNQLKVVLDWNNVKQINVRLTAKEVKELDFFKLVYIDKLASFFYVNKLSYNGSDTSSVEVVQVKKVPIECDLVANTGSYSDITIDDVTFNLDGSSSQGSITSWLWEIISQPSGATATVTTVSKIGGILNDATTVGDYILRLTISNPNCSSVSEVIITQIG